MSNIRYCPQCGTLINETYVSTCQKCGYGTLFDIGFSAEDLLIMDKEEQYIKMKNFKQTLCNSEFFDFSKYEKYSPQTAFAYIEYIKNIIHHEDEINDNEVIKCPSCGSTQISANNRGWSLLTGFIGSGKVVITCLKCGNRWKPGKA